KGNGRLARDDRDGARAAFAEALKADPRLVVAERALALLEDSGRHYETAIERYRRVIAATPNDVLALNNLAYLIAVRAGKPAQALPYADRAARLAPRDANVLDTLAWVHYLSGNARRAETLLAAARQAATTAPDIWVHSAAVHLALGDVATAQRDLREAL